MTLALANPLTFTDFLKPSETQPASEFINGHISQKTMPQGKHYCLRLKVCNAINLVTEPKRIALSFPKLRCTFGDRPIVPDATVFTWQLIIREANGEITNAFNTYLDWAAEILSPDQKATQVIGIATAKGVAIILVVEPSLHGVPQLNLLGDGYNILHCLKIDVIKR